MVVEGSEFKAWQNLQCAWCDNKAKGNALWRHIYWHASCGANGHGEKFKPFLHESA